ncbi:MAG: LacI family DNA-binding transcriptional regulator [Streptococcaceae bacterium]|jgi:DNA-binding LacI/PurR family transcriptional regulator|nr:LacI family DNA-binding transcriptional regulator [Streptococcaceae bacterium]
MSIRKIAEMTGVSKSSVSRVINNDKYVSDDKRKLVQNAIKQMNYVINGNAVNLSKGKTNTIGITLPYNHPCYENLVNHLLFHAKKYDYQVMILPTYYEENTEERYYSMLEKKLIDALILTSRSNIELNWQRLNSVGKVISTEKLINDDISMIYSDRKFAYEELFKNLYDENYSNILFTVKRNQQHSQSTRDKVSCFEKYFGKAVEGKNYFVGLDSYAQGLELGLKLECLPEVIYANGDETAAGIISGLQQQGFVHNQDYKIIGEGNLSFSQLLGFSTIDFRSDEIAKKVIEFILSDNLLIKEKIKPQVIYY